MKPLSLLFFLSVFVVLPTSQASDDFFSLGEIVFYNKEPRKGIVLYQEVQRPDKSIKTVFLPFIRVPVSVKEQTASANVFAKAYFYDKDGKLLEVLKSPAAVDRNDGEAKASMSTFLKKGKKEFIYFGLPEKVQKKSQWHVLVVFGDMDGAVSAIYPQRGFKVGNLDFPEKALVESPRKVIREKALNPLIESVVDTSVDSQPQITLFLRKPIGAADFRETKGVLALCVLAGSVADMKRRLQEADEKDDMTSILNFAEKHRLAIICWGSRALWDPRANWDEIAKKQYRITDKTLDDVAKAWGKGVSRLAQKYGFPANNFLLWGMSGSAQYAARLALRQPQYFLAVHIHVPSSFDKPTPEANQVLWCLTTGEEEAGYERSLKFVEECKKLGYPMVYKAIPNLGHAGHPAAARLGEVFFEYALSLRDEKNVSGEKPDKQKSSSNKSCIPWPASFQNPPYSGDIFRQEIYPSSLPAAEIPPSVLIPLPSEKIAKTWRDGK